MIEKDVIFEWKECGKFTFFFDFFQKLCEGVLSSSVIIY